MSNFGYWSAETEKKKNIYNIHAPDDIAFVELWTFQFIYCLLSQVAHTFPICIFLCKSNYAG